MKRMLVKDQGVDGTVAPPLRGGRGLKRGHYCVVVPAAM